MQSPKVSDPKICVAVGNTAESRNDVIDSNTDLNSKTDNLTVPHETNF